MLNDGTAAEAWTLTPADHALVMIKNSGNRLGFAVLLLFYRAYGRFPKRAMEIDAEALARGQQIPTASRSPAPASGRSGRMAKARATRSARSGAPQPQSRRAQHRDLMQHPHRCGRRRPDPASFRSNRNPGRDHARDHTFWCGSTARQKHCWSTDRPPRSRRYRPPSYSSRRTAAKPASSARSRSSPAICNSSPPAFIPTPWSLTAGPARRPPPCRSPTSRRSPKSRPRRFVTPPKQSFVPLAGSRRQSQNHHLDRRDHQHPGEQDQPRRYRGLGRPPVPVCQGLRERRLAHLERRSRP